MFFLGHEVLGQVLGGLDRRADKTEATQTLFQAIPVHRLVATHVSHSPTGHRQSPQEQRLVDVLGPPRHGRHDKGGGDGKDRTTLLQTYAATQEWLFERGLCKTEERIAPWKRFRNQLGQLPVEILKPVFRRESIREKAIIRRLSQG